MLELKLPKPRVDLFTRNVREEYDKGSIVRQDWVVRSRLATPSDKFPFVQIGVRYLADRAIFEDPSYYPGMLGAGRSIAIGEEQYLVKTLLKQVTTKVKSDDFGQMAILEACRRAGPDFHPSAVFVPLAFHYALHIGKIPGIRLVFHDPIHDSRGTFLECSGLDDRPRVFWSNKYVPFHEVIFVDRNLGEWVVKSADTHWIVVEMKPAKEKTKVDVTVKTIAYLNVLDPRAGLLLDVPPPRR